MVSASGRERHRQSRGEPSPVSVAMDTTPDYALLISTSRWISGFSLSPQQKSTDIYIV